MSRVNSNFIYMLWKCCKQYYFNATSLYADLIDNSLYPYFHKSYRLYFCWVCAELAGLVIANPKILSKDTILLEINKWPVSIMAHYLNCLLWLLLFIMIIIIEYFGILVEYCFVCDTAVITSNQSIIQ